MNKLRIALIGTGRRGSGTYCPIISKLCDDLELVAVCDQSDFFNSLTTSIPLSS